MGLEPPELIPLTLMPCKRMAQANHVGTVSHSSSIIGRQFCSTIEVNDSQPYKIESCHIAWHTSLGWCLSSCIACTCLTNQCKASSMLKHAVSSKHCAMIEA